MVRTGTAVPALDLRVLLNRSLPKFCSGMEPPFSDSMDCPDSMHNAQWTMASQECYQPPSPCTAVYAVFMPHDYCIN
eukprot:SAG31_NODE_488_length_14964_cov_56.443458_2_plen_77_part_00